MAQQQNDASVRIAPNGPYLVRGGVPLQDAGGESLQAPQSYALCRCGGSSSKPFCDGTHARVGFDGAETADHGSIENRRSAYQGKDITIYDDRSLCSHAGVCTDNLAAVFKLGAEPWIDPSGAGAQAIKAVIDRCPSGALSYTEDDGEPAEEAVGPAMTPLKDGPMQVSGMVRLRSSDGSAYDTRSRCTLCRCGGSSNKPFCDGSHWHVGFTDS